MTTHSQGDLVRARGRDWVVLESTPDCLWLRPLEGEEWEKTVIVLGVEPVTIIQEPTPEPVVDVAAQIESLRGLLCSFVKENFTKEGHHFHSTEWPYMAFGAAMYGNMLLGALQGLGCDPKEELQNAMA